MNTKLYIASIYATVCAISVGSTLTTIYVLSKMAPSPTPPHIGTYDFEDVVVEMKKMSS